MGAQAARWPRPWLAGLLGLVLGRALLLGQPGPLGVAWWVAVRTHDRAAGAWAAVGVAGGMIERLWAAGGNPSPGHPIGYLLQVAILFAVAMLLLSGSGARRSAAAAPRAGRDLAWGATAAAAASAVGVLLSEGWEPDWVTLAWVGLISGCLAVVLTHALTLAGVRDLVQGHGWTQVLRQGAGRTLWADPHHRPVAGNYPGDVQAAFLVLGFGLLSGLDGVHFGLLSVQTSFAALVAMLAALAGGPGPGAAAGLLVGLGVILAHPDGAVAFGSAAPAALSFAVGGLAGGQVRALGRSGVAAVFTAVFVAVRWVSAADPGPAMISALAAGILYLVLLQYHRLPLPQPGHESGWTGDHNGTGAAVAVPENNAGTAGAAARARVGALAGVLRELTEVVAGRYRPAHPQPSASPDRLTPMVGEVVERICQGCRRYHHCWHEEFFRTHQIFTDIWGCLEDQGTTGAQAIPAPLANHCETPGEVMVAFRSVADLYQSRRECAHRLQEGQQSLAEQAAAVAGILEQLARDLASPDADPVPRQAVRLRVQTGKAGMAKVGSLTGGDFALSVPLGPHRHAVLLSDGMGSGPGAAALSQQACRLLHRLLSVGFRLDTAARIVNLTLLLRHGSDSFATLDTVILDLASGRADFLKLGAPPSLVRRGRQVRLVRSEAPPVGILDVLPIDPDFRVLRAGDLVLMATDGVWDRGPAPNAPDNHWLMEYLAGLPPDLTPQQVADRVLAASLTLTEGGAPDDVTVIVARIVRAETEGKGAAHMGLDAEP